MEQKQVLVIGGGFSGLAASALAAKNGYTVTLLEKNSTVGGRARVLRTHGFQFDMGPSWYLMPEVFERFFSYFNTTTSDFYQLKRLDPRYRIYFGDGSKIDMADDREQNLTVFNQIVPNSGARLTAYLSALQRVYEPVSNALLHLDMRNPKHWFRAETIRSMFQVISAVNPFVSWEAFTASYFSDPKLKKILEFHSLFLGGTPKDTPAYYSIITWADFGLGVWYPMGGMYTVVDALRALCVRYGVHIETDTAVEKIDVNNGVARGVWIGKRHISADAIINTADLHHAETALLDKQYQTYPESYWNRAQTGISGVILYLGLKNRLKNPVHHTLYFSNDWDENFRAIFDRNMLPTDPSFYVSIRSATDRTIVPKGCEELFILVPVSSTLYGNDRIRKFADTVLDRVESMLGEPIRNSIVVKKLYTAENFAQDYNAFSGTALGLAHTRNQSLLFRPDVQSKKVKGLYYAGQNVHPGVGVPMSLISAELAVRRLCEQQ